MTIIRPQAMVLNIATWYQVKLQASHKDKEMCMVCHKHVLPK